ncbi:MAG TPA: VOC family protein [Elusimicrobiota bacterium]|nr:VOC family protein [Elusimicrobiota bacterium]
MKSIPEGYHTLTPTLVFKDSRKALDFYKKAFGAVETEVMPGPGGKGVMHATMKIGNSNLMMSDESREMPGRSAETLGGSPVAFYLYVENSDAAFKKAVSAGAVQQMPLQDAFWGDRVGTVKDPFGYQWTFATHTRDLTREQIAKGAEEAMAHQAGKK